MLVECINDQNWHPMALPFIKNFPVKGQIYTVIGRNHTVHGLAYVLEEIENPVLPDGNQVAFSVKRFKPVDDVDVTGLMKEITESNSIAA
jgi:hypothetical protein